MDRSTLYLVTKFSTSSRSLVWALCDTGAELGPWPANSSSPRTGTGRPPRASSCQTQNLLNPRCSWAGEGWHLQVGWVAGKGVTFQTLLVTVAPQLKHHRRCYRPAGKKVVWTLSFLILRRKPQWSEHSSVLSLAGVTGTTQLCFSLLATAGLWHCELARKSQKCRNIPLHSIRQKYFALKWKSAYHQV